MIHLRAKLIFTVACWALSCSFVLAGPRKEGADKSGSTEKQKSSTTAQHHSVLKVIAGTFKPTIPRVWLSDGHAKQCKVGVGESFPDVKLPNLNGTMTDLVSLRGRKATVILFWHPDRWMARTALIDMQRDVASRFDPEQVSVVGIAVHQQASALPSILGEANVKFPQLVDSGGEALSQVGTFALPRIYVLDPAGTIVWFDIEYSEATRRELQQTLSVLTAE